MRLFSFRSLTIVCLVVVCACLAHAAEKTPGNTDYTHLKIPEISLLSLDIGGEYTKAAALYVGGGKQLQTDIVLSEQSNRRFPSCVAFRYFKNGDSKTNANDTTTTSNYSRERYFAESAEVLRKRFPTQVFCGLFSRLLSSYVGNSSREVLVPFASNSDSAKANADGEVFSLVELGAMFVDHVRKMALTEEFNTYHKSMVIEAAAEDGNADVEEAIRNAVVNPDSKYKYKHVFKYAAITVPSHAPMLFRQVVVDLVTAVRLRPLLLPAGNTAALVQWLHLKGASLVAGDSGGNGGKENGEKGKRYYIMIYDMGSQQTEASVFEIVPVTIAGGAVRYVATLKSALTDFSLGGNAFDRCIADYWNRLYFGGSLFAQGADGDSNEDTQRTQTLLLDAAKKGRESLSANREIHLSVEGVYVTSGGGGGGKTVFSTVLRRNDFEMECGALFREAVKLRDSVARSLGPDGGAIDRLELIGGATRMPLLIMMLGAGGSGNSNGNNNGGVARADRTLNGDESVVLGASVWADTLLGGGSSGSNHWIETREWLGHSIYVDLFFVAPSADSSAGKTTMDLHHYDSNIGSTKCALVIPKTTTVVPSYKTITISLADDADHSYVTNTEAILFRFQSEEDIYADAVNVDRLYLKSLLISRVKEAYKKLLSLESEKAQELPSSAPNTGADKKPKEGGDNSGGDDDAEKAKEEENDKEEAAAAPVVKQQKINRLRLVSADIIIETFISSSQLPLVSRCQLTATYNATESIVTSHSGGDGDEVKREEVVVSSATETRTLPLPFEEIDNEPAFFGESYQLSDTSAPRLRRGGNLNKKEVLQIRETIDKMNTIDDNEFLFAQMKNDLEGLLIQMRSSNRYTNTDDASPLLSVGKWKQAVSDLSEWFDYLDDKSTTLDELREKKAEAEKLKKKMR